MRYNEITQGPKGTAIRLLRQYEVTPCLHYRGLAYTIVNHRVQARHIQDIGGHYEKYNLRRNGCP